ncbi:flippase activity-associated protein Agl23 [Haladaptatus pallidirubidus]|uniref:TIGR03663 family protein n=1 Tax=Haladaptatus pallidirubidus TaxID=1008152 RepID=A0AAV3UKB3_9EURY|nr:flippase activity-associated protein Agl23 [Haladaptatus pallidirubidus]
MSSGERPVSGWVEQNRGFAGILAVTAVSLALRLFALGNRFAHWDEARVGYWILRYQKTGVFQYHADIHGPFFVQVNSILFQLFGASDFMARLPVALITGLLPLAVWLYRDHLRFAEMVGLALFFAVNPILLYYSRFMRNDVLLAALMLFTLGFYLRAYATGKARYLYLGTATMAVAFTTKENVLLYLLSWLGAGALLLDHRLFLARNRERGWTGVFVEYAKRGGRGLWRFAPHLALCLIELFAIVTYFYAPRARGVEGPGLLKAFGDPSMFGAVVSEATLGSWEKLNGQWVGSQEHAYLPYLEHFVSVLEQGALPLLVFAILGFLSARYVDERPRDLVSFAFYWGAVGILGYPLVTDIKAPWNTVHVVAPLAIPAAVGVALLYRWGKEAYEDDDTAATAATALVCLLVVAQVAFPALSIVYLHPQDSQVPTMLGGQQDNKIVQYGQPASGIKPTLEKVQAVSKANQQGTDVLYYGHVDAQSQYIFYVPDESDNDYLRPASSWYNRLPLPWYTEMADATVDSTLKNESLENGNPPVVIARTEKKSDVEPHLSGYIAYDHELTLYGSETTIYIERSALRQANSTT